MSAVGRAGWFEESHEVLRDAVRRFVETEISPHVDAWEDAGCIPRELYLKAGEVGLLGVGYPARYGGTDSDLFHKIVVAEELMRAGSGGLSASLGSHDIALPPVLNAGAEALRERVIPPVLAGRKIAALAVTEPGGGSDVAAVRTRAELRGDRYIVNGSKTYITSGTQADFYTVAVRTGGAGSGGVSLLLVERASPGLQVGPPLAKMGWHASDTAELFFEDCEIPAAHLLGAEGDGFKILMQNFQLERISLAIMATSTAALALAECERYAHERQAFGQFIAGFQVIRHKLADMATRVEASREFTYAVAARLRAGQPALKQVAMAKNFATDTSDYVTHEAVQIFGGAGFMRGTLVERLYRDNRVLSIGGGTREIMNEIITRELGLP